MSHGLGDVRGGGGRRPGPGRSASRPHRGLRRPARARPAGPRAGVVDTRTCACGEARARRKTSTPSARVRPSRSTSCWRARSSVGTSAWTAMPTSDQASQPIDSQRGPGGSATLLREGVHVRVGGAVVGLAQASENGGERRAQDHEVGLVAADFGEDTRASDLCCERCPRRRALPLAQTGPRRHRQRGTTPFRGPEARVRCRDHRLHSRAIGDVRRLHQDLGAELLQTLDDTRRVAGSVSAERAP